MGSRTEQGEPEVRSARAEQEGDATEDPGKRGGSYGRSQVEASDTELRAGEATSRSDPDKAQAATGESGDGGEDDLEAEGSSEGDDCKESGEGRPDRNAEEGIVNGVETAKAGGARNRRRGREPQARAWLRQSTRGEEGVQTRSRSAALLIGGRGTVGSRGTVASRGTVGSLSSVAVATTVATVDTVETGETEEPLNTVDGTEAGGDTEQKQGSKLGTTGCMGKDESLALPKFHGHTIIVGLASTVWGKGKQGKGGRGGGAINHP